MVSEGKIIFDGIDITFLPAQKMQPWDRKDFSDCSTVKEPHSS